MLATALAAVAFGALAGCGGGGGGSETPPVQVPPPPPIGSPPPAPVPIPTVIYPPPPSAIGSPTDFVLLGVPQLSDNNLIPTSNLSLRWLGQPATYRLRVSDVGEGVLHQLNARDTALKLVNSDGQTLMTSLDIPRPLGRYAGLLSKYGSPFFSVAFGLASDPARLPVTGSRTYRNLVGDTGYLAQVEVDFATREIRGFIDIAWSDAWGPYDPVRYPITPAVLPPGTGEFAMSFPVQGAPSLGQITARFAGPQGEELMIAWRAPIWNFYDDKWETYWGTKILS